MIERLGLLFADDSLLVLPEGVDADTAWREAEAADWGEPEPRTQVVRLRIETLGLRDVVSLRPKLELFSPIPL